MKNISLLFAVMIFWCGSAHAILDVEITQGTEDALPIAVLPFSWSGTEKKPESNWSDVVSSDLLRSGRFAPVPENELLSRPQANEKIDFNT